MNQLVFIATGITVLMAAIVQVQLAVSSTNSKTPAWIPSGYPGVRYYYLPDIEAYYDVKSARFIYYNGLSWIKRTQLPARYKRYDLCTGRKVVMTEFRGKSPYVDFTEHKTKFAKSYQVHPQKKVDMKPVFINPGRNMLPSEYSSKKNSWENLMIEEPVNLEKNLVQE